MTDALAPAPPPDLAGLRDAVAHTHGSRFVAERIATLEARVAALLPGDDGPPPAVEPDALIGRPTVRGQR